jgi:tRNA-dihydrouridine synthase 3
VRWRDDAETRAARRCRFTHDVPVYLAQKPHDIHFPPVSALSSDPPFVHLPDPPTPAPEGGDAAARPIDASLDAATICPVFAETGACRHGLKCRFLGAHARVADGTVELIEHGDHAAAATLGAAELNFAGAETLTLLRKRKVRTLRAFYVSAAESNGLPHSSRRPLPQRISRS